MAKKRKSKSRRSKRTNRPRQPKQVVRTTRPATPKTYPSPVERERIIAQRDKLWQEVIPILIQAGDGGKSSNQGIAKLAQKYGLDEIRLVLDKFQQSATRRELIGEEAFLYRLYRQTFARFGGNRSFLNKQDYEELIFEYGKMAATRKLKLLTPFLGRPSAREKKLHDLLLVGVDYWEDITPPAVPPRPPDFVSPPPGSYDDPVQALLQWGWEIDKGRFAAKAKNTAEWRPAIPELERMVFDEGLLDGWPGETDNWAPFHALQMLGYLKAYEYAGELLVLLDRENDWLSDRLSVVWGRMGPSAEPPLWDYVVERSHDPKKRSVVFRGLSKIVEFYPKHRLDIINNMADLLHHAPADDATANAYLVHVLDRMDAVEASETILDAFEQNKIDPKIMQPYDVDFIQDW